MGERTLKSTRMKWIAALAIMLVFVATLLAGCGGQGSAGNAASSQAVPQSKEDLLAEITQAMEVNYESVTVDGEMTMPMPSTGGSTSIPLILKMDLSGDTVREYMAMSMGYMAEIFVDGNNAEAFYDGTPTEISPEDLGLGDLSSPTALQEQFGGGLLENADVIKDVVKEYDGDETVYTITFDPDKLSELANTESFAQQYNVTTAPEAAEEIVRVGKDGRLSAMSMNMTISGSGGAMNTRWYDYNNTIVPPLPSVEDERNASVDPDAVYGGVLNINYGTDNGFGQTSPSLLPYSLDEHGNITSYLNLVRDGSDIATVEYVSEYDEDGWRTSQNARRIDGKGDPIQTSVTTEKDSQGRATKVTSNNASNSSTTTTQYEYYENGALKSSVSQSASGRTTTEEFDEGGFRTSIVSQTENGTIETRFTWEKDADGKAVGYTVQNLQNGSQVMEKSCNVKTDAAGNIVQVTDRDTGRIIQRSYWQKIDDPSLYASLMYKLKR